MLKDGRSEGHLICLIAFNLGHTSILYSVGTFSQISILNIFFHNFQLPSIFFIGWVDKGNTHLINRYMIVKHCPRVIKILMWPLTPINQIFFNPQPLYFKWGYYVFLNEVYSWEDWPYPSTQGTDFWHPGIPPPRNGYFLV